MENNQIYKNYYNENAPGFVVEYVGDFKGQIDKVNYAFGDIITKNLAVVSVEEKNIERLRRDVPAIVFIEARGLYVLQDTSPVNVDAIAPIRLNPYLNLTGRGIIVGIVDTGIDYMNREFMREDGTSRIIKIWDQSIQPNKENELYIGTEYTNEEINKAIQASKNGGNPYDIVPSKDEIGHGTSMASIIGARGYNQSIEGVANDCEFMVVRLSPSYNYQKTLRENNLPIVPVYNTSEVIAAIEYLRRNANQLRRPMVLFLGVGSQDGSHDGAGITSRFITAISRRRDIVLVAGTGNSGNAEGHSTNFLSFVGDVKTSELLIPREIKAFGFEVWVRKPNKMSLNIVAPTGAESGYIRPSIQSVDTRQFYLLNTQVEIRGYDPDGFTGHQLFILRFTGIKPGIWKINLRGEYLTNGRYDIWLRDRTLLPEGTKFLNPNPNNTLTVPSTASNVISVSYYDGVTKAIVSASGRGFSLDNVVKPEIATEGINILAISSGSDVVTRVSGSSAATAIVTGVCALLLQWGIIDGNDTTLYSIKLKSLLVYAADRSGIFEYPNKELGYGRLNLQDVFRVMGGNYRSDNEYLEYSAGNLYVRVPKEIMNVNEGDNYGK